MKEPGRTVLWSVLSALRQKISPSCPVIKSRSADEVQVRFALCFVCRRPNNKSLNQNKHARFARRPARVASVPVQRHRLREDFPSKLR